MDNELRPKANRLQYSELKTSDGQAYSEFVAKKEELFDKWEASQLVQMHWVTGIVDLAGY